MFMTLYGIKNCNTVKNAINWLNSKKVSFEFHDYKSKGITGWENLVNKRGTTWRQLDDATQKKVISEKAAIALMLDKTSVIKRPLAEDNGKVVALGFDESVYNDVFS
jgi:arsenate reductase